MPALFLSCWLPVFLNYWELQAKLSVECQWFMIAWSDYSEHFIIKTTVAIRCWNFLSRFTKTFSHLADPLKGLRSQRQHCGGVRDLNVSVTHHICSISARRDKDVQWKFIGAARCKGLRGSASHCFCRLFWWCRSPVLPHLQGIRLRRPPKFPELT